MTTTTTKSKKRKVSTPFGIFAIWPKAKKTLKTRASEVYTARHLQVQRERAWYAQTLQFSGYEKAVEEGKQFFLII